MKRRLLIVGAGPTGSNIASNFSGITSLMTIWEKSTSPGRFAVNTPRGAAATGGAVCDLGAQYFTAYDARTNQYLSQLQSAGKVKRLPQNSIIGARGFDEHPQYVSVTGSASLVNDALDRAVKGGVEVKKNKRLIALSAVQGFGEASKKSVWRATDEDGNDSIFDAVALTIPAPQVLQLKGNLADILTSSGVGKALTAVTYSTRLVLALYFPESAQELFEERVPWFGRFVNRDEPGGDVIRYLSFETMKRRVVSSSGSGDDSQGEGKGVCPSFISHSTVEYGAAHENDEDYKKALEGVLVRSTLQSLAKAIGLSESDLPSPIEARVHRWKYSQVTRAIAMTDEFVYTTALTADGGDGKGEKETAALLIQGGPVFGEDKTEALLSPPLFLAGDYFTSSNLAGCLKSAHAVSGAQ